MFEHRLENQVNIPPCEVRRKEKEYNLYRMRKKRMSYLIKQIHERLGHNK